MNTPTSSKLTMKGDVSEKVAKKGVDPKALVNYNGALSAEDVDISKEAQAIAKKVCKRIADEKSSAGVSYADLYNQLNGTGYMEHLEARIAKDVTEMALGTATQTRAYKDTLVANTALEHSDFVATPKGAGPVSAKANPFG